MSSTPRLGPDATTMAGRYADDIGCFELVVGTIFGGRYRFERILGKGGMGVVAAAVDIRSGDSVALKIPLHEVGSGKSLTTAEAGRFVREGRLLAELQNDHVVRCLGMGMHNDEVPFLVMDLLVGETLGELRRREPTTPVPFAVEAMAQACDGIAAMHALGIVHRDIKPTNIFLERTANGTQRTKILDLGVATDRHPRNEVCDEPSFTRPNHVVGTVRYMAPEQLESARSVDGRADVWSLGAVLYELLASRPPYASDNITRYGLAIVRREIAPLRALRPDVPVEVERLVMQCLVRDPDLRPQSAASLATSLRAAIATIKGARDVQTVNATDSFRMKPADVNTITATRL